MHKNFWLVSCIILAIVAVFYLNSRPQAAGAGPAGGVSLDRDQLISMEGFRLVSQEFDKQKMKITAKKAALTKRQFREFRLALGNVVEMEEPCFVFNCQEGEVTISSRKAVVDPLVKEVVFQDGCVVKSAKNRLSSDHITWKYSRGFIEVRHGYLLARNGRETKGDNAVINIGLNKFNLTNGAL